MNLLTKAKAAIIGLLVGGDNSTTLFNSTNHSISNLLSPLINKAGGTNNTTNNTASSLPILDHVLGGSGIAPDNTDSSSSSEEDKEDNKRINNNGLCMLCEEGMHQMLWPLTIVHSSGSTCTSLALDMAVRYTAGSSQCQADIAKWRNTCCGNTPPKAVDLVIPAAAKQKHKKIGPHQRCGVCHNGDYPTDTSMVLTVLYIGSGSCVQFEKAGQQGLIPAHMCDPIQYYGYEPCGCGEFAKVKKEPQISMLRGRSGEDGGGGRS